MNVSEFLQTTLLDAFHHCFSAVPDPKLIQIQETRKEFKGDYTINVFPLLRYAKGSPEQTATKIGEWLTENTKEIVDFEVVKGFLNLVFSDSYWIESVKEAFQNPQFGYKNKSGKTVLLEYSSPNTNKPLHLGHMRNIFLGYAVSEILKANGHEVYKVQVVNDRGIHICKSMIAWLLFGNGESPETTGIKGDHLVGKYYVIYDQTYKKQVAELIAQGKSKEEAEQEAAIFLQAKELLRKWEAKDAEVYALWEKMNTWVYNGFDVTYKRLGIGFDTNYYESNTYLLGKKVIAEGLEKGVFYKKADGSIWIDLTAEGLDEKLLLRSDGTAVYMTQDIGTAIQRYEDYPTVNQMIYTVGNEQDYHFKVLFLILQKLGYSWAKECYHLSYGMVELPEGKMKSREGTVVDADELMETMVQAAREEGEKHGTFEQLNETEKTELSEMIGMAALKYFLLRVDPKKKMLFNPKESIDLTGNTGPFIQYTHARLKAILRRAETVNTDFDAAEINEKERSLSKILVQFPQAIEDAGNAYSPAILINYTYELVKAYNSFYQSVSIFNAENNAQRDLRIMLSAITASVVKQSMAMLGINVPERM